MLVLSARTNEKIRLPEQHTTIEIVAVQSGTVRLGISAPDDVRILREGLRLETPNGSATAVPDETGIASLVSHLPALKKLLDKRLEIAHVGLEQARQRLQAGQEEEAQILIDKVDEDLHLLRRRLRREFEKAEMLTCGV